MDALKSKAEIEFYIAFIDGVIELKEIKNIHENISPYLSNDTLGDNYFLSETIQFDTLCPCICFRKY
jgi:hypothetical protein